MCVRLLLAGHASTSLSAAHAFPSIGDATRWLDAASCTGAHATWPVAMSQVATSPWRMEPRHLAMAMPSYGYHRCGCKQRRQTTADDSTGQPAEPGSSFSRHSYAGVTETPASARPAAWARAAAAARFAVARASGSMVSVRLGGA